MQKVEKKKAKDARLAEARYVTNQFLKFIRRNTDKKEVGK